MMQLTKISRVSDIPDEWDKIAENYFQRRKFLGHCEKFNPCNQRYYLASENSELHCCSIVYTLQLDLLTYLKIKSPIKMHICGVPVSASSQGIFGEEKYFELFKNQVFTEEKGFQLYLNLDSEPNSKKSASGTTLPTIIIQNDFPNFNSMLDSMRADYRRRLRLLMKLPMGMEFKLLENSEFTMEHHQLYLEVFKRSSGKLEELGLDFFSNLPHEFELNCCYISGKLAGWNIGLVDGQTYYFFLGGVDYGLNAQFDVYLRLMLQLVKSSVDRGFKVIDLGQTAETPKLRIGGFPVRKFMEARHSNPLLNGILKLASPLLSYKPKFKNHNVFKEEVK